MITTDYLGPPGTNSATGGLYLTPGPFPVIFGIPPLLDYFHSDRIHFFLNFSFQIAYIPCTMRSSVDDEIFSLKSLTLG